MQNAFYFFLFIISFLSLSQKLSLSHISLLSHQKFLSVAHYKQLKIEFRFGFGLCGCGFVVADVGSVVVVLYFMVALRLVLKVLELPHVCIEVVVVGCKS